MFHCAGWIFKNEKNWADSQSRSEIYTIGFSRELPVELEWLNKISSKEGKIVAFQEYLAISQNC